MSREERIKLFNEKYARQFDQLLKEDKRDEAKKVFRQFQAEYEESKNEIRYNMSTR